MQVTAFWKCGDRPMVRWRGLGLALAGGLVLTACGRADQQALPVVVIGAPGDLASGGAQPADAARLMRGATSEGLVTLDADGNVVPGIADRWIVTDDGLSYIFRIRGGAWADGGRMTGETARAALMRAIGGVAGTPLALDLAPVAEVRAMAGRVLELRLSHPMPDLLQLLAQPELGLQMRGRQTGSMTAKAEGEAMRLTAVAPERRGLPSVEGWSDLVRPLILRSLPAERALADYAAGRAAVLLGGTFADLPRLRRGVIGANLPGRATPRIDPVVGLFGLAVENEQGLLAIRQNREALAMAIDREALAQRLGMPGWVVTSRIVTPGLDGDPGAVGERWADYDLAGRRTMAAQRIATWAKVSGKPAVLRIALPQGPGADLLAERLAVDLAAIGVTLQRVAINATADLRLVDRVARYRSPVWYMNQLHCRVRRPCSAEADALLAKALEADPATGPSIMAQAERAAAEANLYIPLGQPIRWSLAPNATPGYAINGWALHPLAPMAVVRR
ncbi:ABC transporter substrate-binding protein [Novosphingobium sp. FSY-8]|uniref:ABC transporter substrate-binding protein n=1 Tax=Novosphingobium ovatum TaxID=1908523 RepID=A0ABW9XGN4_9SPHN|nr:ABC transporter substrate-binding protein [Novosphingobium ovatum]NBC37666.1 ABC transporter substrate-binding protein [Novosphingobium ovatum]